MADDKITINVGGQKFTTYKCTLSKYPNTVLGSLVLRWDNKEEYFFDRSYILFDYVLNFYRTGIINKPNNVDYDIWKTELEFWGISYEDKFLNKRLEMKSLAEEWLNDDDYIKYLNNIENIFLIVPNKYILNRLKYESGKYIGLNFNEIFKRCKDKQNFLLASIIKRFVYKQLKLETNTLNNENDFYDQEIFNVTLTHELTQSFEEKFNKCYNILELLNKSPIFRNEISKFYNKLGYNCEWIFCERSEGKTHDYCGVLFPYMNEHINFNDWASDCDCSFYLNKDNIPKNYFLTLKCKCDVVKHKFYMLHLTPLI